MVETIHLFFDYNSTYEEVLETECGRGLDDSGGTDFWLKVGFVRYCMTSCEYS